jgi:hypothetical protein
MSEYMIVDATHPSFTGRMNALKAASAAKGINFVPRMSMDGTKALIQIKDAVPIPPWAYPGQEGVLGHNGPGKTQKERETWAREQVQAAHEEWNDINDPLG